MVTEIRRQRSCKALVVVSLGKGGAGAEKPPHGPFSIYWARSSSPVLQQFPARLVRVNKASAKVKETYKKDIRQTVTSLDPEEAQIEWHNCLRSFSIWKWIKETCFVFFFFHTTASWIHYEPSIHFDTEHFMNTKPEKWVIIWHFFFQEQFLFADPHFRNSRFLFWLYNFPYHHPLFYWLLYQVLTVLSSELPLIHF